MKEDDFKHDCKDLDSHHVYYTYMYSGKCLKITTIHPSYLKTVSDRNGTRQLRSRPIHAGIPEFHLNHFVGVSILFCNSC